MPDEPLRLALIGAGRHARALSIPAIQLTPGVQLVALATSRAESAAAVQAQFGLPAYVGHEEVLRRDDVQAVLIAAPNAAHVPLTLAALRAGKHVYCETPGVYTPRDVQEVGEARARSGRVLTYGTHLRYAPIYEKLRSLIPDARGAGNVVLAARFYPWVRHMYDLALHLLGDVATVTCRRQAGQVITLLDYASGDLGLIHSGGPPNVAIALEHVEVGGAGGRVAADGSSELRAFVGHPAIDAHDLAFDSAPGAVWSPTASIPYPGLLGFTLRGYIPALEWFARAVRTGEPTPSSLEQAERTLRIERAVARALAEGRPIEVEPPFPLP